MRIATAVTWFFARGVVVDVRRDTWVPPYIALFCRAGPVCPAVGAGKTRAGRCGERIERRRWRMKRDERVAAVKILSVRRKAAQKFWAPQQDHRPLRRVTRGVTGGRPQGSPLRKRNKRCNGRVVREADPYGRLQEVRGFMPGRRWWGGRSRTYRHPRGGGGCGW